MKREWTIIFLTGVIVFSLQGTWFRLTYQSRQLENLKIAEKLVPQVEAILATNPRYHKVQVDTYTGMDGALRIGGSVEKTTDLNQLMRLLAEEQLPIALKGSVKVWEELEKEHTEKAKTTK